MSAAIKPYMIQPYRNRITETYEISDIHTPRLNIAIPSPASDRIKIDRAMIAGISIPHLDYRAQTKRQHKCRDD